MPTHDLIKRFPRYAQQFPVWAEQSNGMTQFVLWTALEAEGLGATLQHYNPIVDQRAAAEWNIPLEWSLRGQLVFGGRANLAKEKTFLPLESRMFVHGV
jgi:predicted oxidoreductase (fatty acid repression mutant protein)